MKEQFEAQILPGGKVQLIFENGETRILSIKESREFIDEYITDLEVLYPDHLKSIDKLLRLDLGEKYNSMILNVDYHKELITTISLSCCAGALDNKPDRDKTGRYNFEHTTCPRRATCPFNGYNPKVDPKNAICNPLLKTELTKTERIIAAELRDTDLTLAQIGAKHGIVFNTVKSHQKHIYVKLGINSLPELINKLANQRIL